MFSHWPIPVSRPSDRRYEYIRSRFATSRKHMDKFTFMTGFSRFPYLSQISLSKSRASRSTLNHPWYNINQGFIFNSQGLHRGSCFAQSTPNVGSPHPKQNSKRHCRVHNESKRIAETGRENLIFHYYLLISFSFYSVFRQVFLPTLLLLFSFSLWESEGYHSSPFSFLFSFFHTHTTSLTTYAPIPSQPYQWWNPQQLTSYWKWKWKQKLIT